MLAGLCVKCLLYGKDSSNLLLNLHGNQFTTFEVLLPCEIVQYGTFGKEVS